MNAKTQNAPLDRFQWHNRVLLVFYEADNDSRELAVFPKWGLETNRYYQKKAGIVDRDLLVFFISDKWGKVSPLMIEGYSDQWDSLPDSDALYKSYRPDFSDDQMYYSVLVGKDGTVKERWDKLAPLDEVFALIDSMPMRQREIGRPD